LTVLVSGGFSFSPLALGLFQAPSLCKALNQNNTTDNNFIVVAKNFADEL